MHSGSSPPALLPDRHRDATVARRAASQRAPAAGKVEWTQGIRGRAALPARTLHPAQDHRPEFRKKRVAMTGKAQDGLGGGSCVIHASCAGLDADRGLLIIGPSGAGKSALALELMALGAWLVADDRTCLTGYQGRLYAQAPPALAGKIEARGLGILRSESLERVRVRAAVDLGCTESQRLPDDKNNTITFQNVTIPLIFAVQKAYFPAALIQFLKAGRACCQ